ncbi:kunitz-type serine protease inhibitor A-like [Oratosquilla oratoria]|uniref:kunitz-type serine protease inhibitor A-like n=1 Tax=Oratosquilla oratoria TaxID=337810 RepID=UPI003F774B72
MAQVQWCSRIRGSKTPLAGDEQKDTDGRIHPAGHNWPIIASTIFTPIFSSTTFRPIITSSTFRPTPTTTFRPTLTPLGSTIPGEQTVAKYTCLKPPSSGRGPFKHIRYFYEAERDYCREFTYHGYGSNGNNFCSRGECFAHCDRVNFLSERSASTEQSPALHLSNSLNCAERLDSGYGTFHLPRYYYDSNVRQCAPFIYRGFGGNLNNFCSWRECMAYCK